MSGSHTAPNALNSHNSNQDTIHCLVFVLKSFWWISCAY